MDDERCVSDFGYKQCGCLLGIERVERIRTKNENVERKKLNIWISVNFNVRVVKTIIQQLSNKKKKSSNITQNSKVYGNP